MFNGCIQQTDYLISLPFRSFQEVLRDWWLFECCQTFSLLMFLIRGSIWKKEEEKKQQLHNNFFILLSGSNLEYTP